MNIKDEFLKKITQKNFSELKITDKFMFEKIMKDEFLAKPFLEILLDLKIKNLENVFLGNGSNQNSKGILTFEAFIEKNTKPCKIELRIENNKNPGLKSLYYQSMLNSNSFRKSENFYSRTIFYDIFICTFDPVGRGKFEYTAYSNLENENKKDSDEFRIIKFINAESYKKAKNSEQRSLMEYFATGFPTSKIGVQIERLLTIYKNNDSLRKEYNNQKDFYFNKNSKLDFYEGKKVGAYNAAMNIAKNLLKDGMSPAKVARFSNIPLIEIEKFNIEKQKNFG